ncbi:N-acetyl-gamma-glutamyl-phosphate reductase [Dehalobacterium formicoaceticum]|uniref:N-acetyl-gamma-glutamyl-phosphate reductase n=1 Tax=Dehalobacterium formicoaceticum TaxID=51515 RepID=A0ABT1Y205_9FIRM|nr:N-acetyl-gamma-glutamyl-phosphate reductase [Dehalobacterium formicoaceticum]MCR6543999.1 N-acetyl-gamma-glutamyl-phosphate reductase [Dehalobacterium formicoaceticum]
MIKVSVIGATGYAGVELIRLLVLHPDVKLSCLTSKTYAGQKIQEVYPHLNGLLDHELQEQNDEEIGAVSDVVFLALPHGHAVSTAQKICQAGKKVIDLGADLRFRDTDIYEEWYHVKHENPALSQEAVYGLPEINRGKIKEAQAVGNPGCYPTSTILAMYPLIKEGLIDLNTIIVDSKSGISGAGRNAVITSLYGESAENLKAYNVGKHRHTPEIEQALGEAAGKEVLISFTPHLIPMTRGILTTAYATLNQEGAVRNLHDLYQSYYQDEYFVRLHQPGIWPQTKWVTGTNFCDLGLMADPRTNRVIVTAVIDNLVKGAAGQAVQNMNILFNLPEKAGLEQVPLYP